MQIGRTKSSAVYIKDPAVSQKHARVEWTGSKYTITDLGSSNGTTVNEKEIREGEPRAIRHGDVVVVGTDTVVRVSVDAATGQRRPRRPRSSRAARRRARRRRRREAAAAKREEAREGGETGRPGGGGAKRSGAEKAGGEDAAIRRGATRAKTVEAFPETAGG